MFSKIGIFFSYGTVKFDEAPDFAVYCGHVLQLILENLHKSRSLEKFVNWKQKSWKE